MAPALAHIARRAGAAIMDIRAGSDLQVRGKADDSPVTRADLAADAIIFDALQAAWPDTPVVTEERPDTHAATGPHFLVDPLDGTKDFIHQGDDFTVNIALIEQGAPVAGVVYAPAHDRLFRTDAALGAVEEYGDGRSRALRAAPGRAGALRAVASKSHFDPQTRAYLEHVRPVETARVGSSLKICLIAAGEADLYPRFGPTMHWDTAAADAVLRAAGGRVLRLPELREMRYEGPDRRNPDFIAAGDFDPPPP